MDRVYHVSKTLPINIRDNIGCPNIEFVLLDYNSKDNLESWVRSNMMNYIQTGLLKYCRTNDPVRFHISHAKNLVSRLSSCEILCMMDADNYTGPGYVDWVSSVFTERGDKSFVLASEEDIRNFGDLGGKICIHRNLFETARGYDESMIGYGMEDVDIAHRLVKAGAKKVFIEDKAFLKYIAHSTEDRLKNYDLLHQVENVYIQVHVNESMEKKAVILYVMHNNIYNELTYKFSGVAKGDLLATMKGWFVEENGYKEGEFVRQEIGGGSDDRRALFNEEGKRLLRFEHGNKSVWERIPRESPLFMRLLVAHSSGLNFIKYQENEGLGKAINTAGWGKGKVYLNFNYTNPVNI